MVQKLWNYCNILRDDGLSYGVYASVWLSTGLEQMKCLLFFNMADEPNSLLGICLEREQDTPIRTDGR